MAVKSVISRYHRASPGSVGFRCNLNFCLPLLFSEKIFLILNQRLTVLPDLLGSVTAKDGSVSFFSVTSLCHQR